MAFLRQSTEASVRFGPFLSQTDGVTEKTAAATTPVPTLSKNHATFTARSSATAAVFDSAGWWGIPLNVTDTGTLGPLVLRAQDATAYLPVWREFVVLPAHAYDALVQGTDFLSVDVAHVRDASPNVLVAGRVDALANAVSSQAATEIASANWNQTRGGYNGLNTFGRLVQADGVTVATNNDKTGYAIGTGGITTLSFAASAISEAVLGAGALAVIADKWAGRGVQGGSDGGRTNAEAMFALRNKVLRVDTLATVFATDDVTAAWTAALGTTNVSSFVTSVDPT